MKITALKETRAGRVALSFDGEYVASLDKLTVAQYGLRVGDELDERTTEEIMACARRRRTTSKAVELLSYRDHSALELKRKLMRSATEDEADEAVGRMQELDMINDESFAKKLSEELSEFKLYGPHRIRQELMKRGVQREYIESALANLPPQSEILSRLTARFRMHGDIKERDRLFRRLASRGFDYDEVKSALSAFELICDEDIVD